MHLGPGALYIGVGNHVAHLGGVGDHLVVVLRRGDGDVAEPGGGEQLFHPVQQENVVPLPGDHHHGGPLEHVRLAVGVARVLGARHGVSAHIGEAVLICQGETHLTDLPLHAAAVHDQGVWGDIGGDML